MPADKIILLVEDNADDEVLTLRALKKNAIDNEVVIARDGVEALEYLMGTGAHAGRDTTIQPHVVLLDLNLPRLSGHQVLARMRTEQRTRHIPVVVLTSSKEEEDIVQSYEAGANAYVRKPVEFAEFSDAVKAFGQFWLVVNECAAARRA